MKGILLYCLTTLMLLFTSCTKTEVDTAQGEGRLQLRILAEAGAAGDYNPLDFCTIRIYSSDGLIRKYDTQTAMPAELWLPIGSYSIRVEAGDKSAASFTHKSYRGEKDFTITKGAATAVEVRCNLLNAVVAVTYDATIPAKFLEGFSTGVCAGDHYDQSLIADGKALAYTTNGTGYFLLPEGVNTLAWAFSGQLKDGSSVTRTGKISPVKAAGKYTLTLRYSAAGQGSLEFALSVDETTDDWDDTIIFDPNSNITIAGDGFDISQPQPYVSGEKRVLISATNTIKTLSLQIGSRTIDLLNSVEPGVTVAHTTDKNYTVTFGAALFAPLSGGSHTFTFAVTDTGGQRATANAYFLTSGVLPIATSDYDLWQNTARLKAQITDANPTSVAIQFRQPGQAWQQLPATKGVDGLYMATVSPTWNTSTNASGLTIHTVAPQTGIFANKDYEYQAVVNGNAAGCMLSFKTTATQPIPYGDMEDATLSCFTTNNKTAPVWGSGNNSFTKTLCTQSTHIGMGGSYCAKLKAAKAPFVNVLAAGNLFTGTFTQQGTGGDVDFGQDYPWIARPTALKLKYHATIGIVDCIKHTGAGVIKGDQDIASIFVCIVNWNNRHKVSSSIMGCSGMWHPESISSTAEGAIIGYGSAKLTQSTSGEAMVELLLPINYYDTTTRPDQAYKIVIACSSSLYGDYMAGCSTNELYLDDFEWVY
ncbi:MAG: DUF4493 domain-containing protein [Alistipes sp.]